MLFFFVENFTRSCSNRSCRYQFTAIALCFFFLLRRQLLLIILLLLLSRFLFFNVLLECLLLLDHLCSSGHRYVSHCRLELLLLECSFFFLGQLLLGLNGRCLVQQLLLLFFGKPADVNLARVCHVLLCQLRFLLICQP